MSREQARAAACAALALALAACPRHAGAGTEGGSPSSRFAIGFEERLRSENWDNSTDFDAATTDARHQLRFRTRLWGKLEIAKRAELMLGLDNESRWIATPDTPFSWDETIFETLYLDYQFSDHLRARVGRQNVTRGEGFLLLEGGPLDGSRSIYMNAIVATLNFGKSKLELLAISDPSSDQYLPRFDDKEKTLVEWDERALGLYYTESRIPATAVEGYYFFKMETDDIRPASNPARQPDSSLHTLGGRATHRFPCGFSATAELAGQLGRQDPDADVYAWGSLASVKKAFECASKPSVALGWIGLSGDDPASATVEGWDPLFSRYSKWSELYIYTLGSEKGVAYWTNLAALQAEFQIKPLDPFNLRATYYHMGAFHPFPGKPSIYAGGRTRGDLFEVRADVKVNGNWRGHVVGEWLAPGDFYAGTDGGWFFRAEVIGSFERAFGL